MFIGAGGKVKNIWGITNNSLSQAASAASWPASWKSGADGGWS